MVLIACMVVNAYYHKKQVTSEGQTGNMIFNFPKLFWVKDYSLERQLKWVGWSNKFRLLAKQKITL